jgi:competence protein ComEA
LRSRFRKGHMEGLRLYFGLLWAALAVSGFAQDGSAQLPEGKGKDAVKKICSACHELETATGSLRTRIGWQQNVDDMIARGAEGSDDEMQAVVEYLAKYFGKINVNTATARELETELGFSDKEAQAIVAFKERNGGFQDFEQLKKTPGVSESTLEAKRSRIAFSQ